MCFSLIQVKQIMEEAVTRKFVHADSSHIISFCGKRFSAHDVCSDYVKAKASNDARNKEMLNKHCDYIVLPKLNVILHNIVH